MILIKIVYTGTSGLDSTTHCVELDFKIGGNVTFFGCVKRYFVTYILRLKYCTF